MLKMHANSSFNLHINFSESAKKKRNIVLTSKYFIGETLEKNLYEAKISLKSFWEVGI
jgi:hypothetical protein